jgi:hypothetical protein
MMVGSLWKCSLVGAVLIVTAVWIGWLSGPASSFPLVRFIRWWLVRIMLPRLGSPSWWYRAGVIAVNNISILAVLVALGVWPVAALTGVALCGVSMGIALRILPGLSGGFALPVSGWPVGFRWRVWAGVALNLLEPPAIVLAIGLSIGQRSIPLPADQAWASFALWVVPAMLLAAGGEALWLGAAMDPHTGRDFHTPETTDPPEEF